MDLSRRQFAQLGIASLSGLTSFGFRDDTLAVLSSLSQEPGGPTDEKYWAEVRNAFYTSPDLIVFNNIGLAPPPKAVVEAEARELKRAAADPSYIIWRKQDSELGSVRKDLAQLVGCQEDELALTMNATYGLQTVIMGIDLSPGDEIVATSHEYPRVHTAIEQRVSRDKAVHVTVEVGPQALTSDEFVRKVLDAVTPKTKLVVLSRISFLIGQIVPVARLCSELNKRNIPVLVDTAQSIGLLEDTMDSMECSIQVACLHKWIMGPIGTGIMAVRSSYIERIWPLHPADSDLKNRMTKFEQTGTRPAAHLLALRESLELHHRLTAAAKRERLVYLRARLAERVLNLPGAIQYGSLDPNVCLPMLTVGFDRQIPSSLAGDLLSKYKIHVTTATRAEVNGIRISPNVFTSVAEVDLLANALAELVK